ncbi:hypothetical protein FOZ62_002099, partial [Perkinsus olseni]
MPNFIRVLTLQACLARLYGAATTSSYSNMVCTRSLEIASIILKLNQAACLLALERFCEAAGICEDLIKNGKLGERREKTIYRLISALIGVAEDGEDETKTLSRARQLLDDFTGERTLKISLQNRIFSLARSLSIRLRPP